MKMLTPEKQKCFVPRPLPGLCPYVVQFYKVLQKYPALVFLLSAGNDYIHMLTSRKRQRLRIDLKDWEGNTRYAKYDNFRVDSEHEKYRLESLGSYTGNAGWYGNTMV